MKDRLWRIALGGGELGFRCSGARDEGDCARFLDGFDADMDTFAIYRAAACGASQAGGVDGADSAAVSVLDTGRR